MVYRPSLVATGGGLRIGRFEVAWADIVEVAGRYTGGRSPMPYVEFQIADPAALYGIRNSPRRVMPRTWHLDANGLLSTITYLAENPAVATGLTSAQFEAPPRPQRPSR